MITAALRGQNRRSGARVIGVLSAAAAIAALAPPATAVACDGAPAKVVIAWNQALLNSTRPLPGTAIVPRIDAIVQASVFDAVNGITRIYHPFHDANRAPRGASPAAAAAGAAYEALRVLVPADATTFMALLDKTVPGRTQGAAARGVAWGESVADDILAWRADDGFFATPPTYTPSSDPGRWQPTPPLFVGPVNRQFATARPFAIASPSRYRPAPPPALTSARYAADYAEAKAYGSIDSTIRTAYGTQTAELWAADGPQDLWEPAADALIASRHLGLTDAARVLAQMNVAMIDATVAIWAAKNYYDTWRPITAIDDAAADGNPATQPDPTWQPLLFTPPFQEYPSGHAGISQAGAAVLASRFGNDTAFAISTPNMPGVVHTFTSFRAAVAEVTTARIDAGFHFRFACDAADVMGRRVAHFVTSTTMQPLGERES